ncbi:MAG TPA: hypothetical protein VN690_00420, partial [Terriglobales bacterium]|nr:hypothetical protein [Terriglobales bacterium]
EARASAGSVAEVSRPECLLYIARQEMLAGEGELAERDFEAGFRQAVALPDAGLAVAIKREVEAGALQGLIEAGAAETAAQLVPSADAARGAIADALVPYQLAHHEIGFAWSTWDRLAARASGFPNRAAAKLYGEKAGSRARRDQLLAAAEAKAVAVEGLWQAEQAMDFLEAAAGEDPNATGLAAATRGLASRLPGLAASAWEADAIAARAVALVKQVDAAHPLVLQPAAPRLSARAAPAKVAGVERDPASDLAPYTAAQAAAANATTTSALSWRDRPAGFHPADHLTPAIAAAAPSYVARWARSYYCEANRPRDAYALLGLALDAVDAQVAKPRAANVLDYDGVPFWVYGLAAQMDLPLAAAHAEGLPEGWFKPLALAHVARMAVASGRNRPGRDFQILY